MELLGHIRNGVVVFDGGTPPPEGTAVAVVPAPVPKASQGYRVDFPIVRDGEPGSWVLTNEMIAEILDAEDIQAMKDQWNVPS